MKTDVVWFPTSGWGDGAGVWVWKQSTSQESITPMIHLNVQRLARHTSGKNMVLGWRLLGLISDTLPTRLETCWLYISHQKKSRASLLLFPDSPSAQSRVTEGPQRVQAPLEISFCPVPSSQRILDAQPSKDRGPGPRHRLVHGVGMLWEQLSRVPRAAAVRPSPGQVALVLWWQNAHVRRCGPLYNSVRQLTSPHFTGEELRCREVKHP